MNSKGRKKNENMTQTNFRRHREENKKNRTPEKIQFFFFIYSALWLFVF